MTTLPNDCVDDLIALCNHIYDLCTQDPAHPEKTYDGEDFLRIPVDFLSAHFLITLTKIIDEILTPEQKQMYDFDAFITWYAVTAVIHKTPVSLLDAQMEF